MNAIPYVHLMKAGAPRARTNFWTAWIAPLVLLPIALIGPNTGLALYACIILGVATSLLSRPGESPILLLIFLYQFIQAALGLFYGNLRGVSLIVLSNYPGQDDLAVFLLLTGLLVLAIAMRLTAGRPIRGLFPRVRTFVALRPLRFWVLLFLCAWIFNVLCIAVAYASGGLRQILLSLADIKWAAFILLTLATFAVPKRSKVPWIVAFCFQFALSIGGYFSSFKDVFIYALIGLLASNVRFRVRIVVPVAILAGIVIFFGLLWTAIKKEYRMFVNQGSGQQVVLVSYSDQIAEIYNLASNLQVEDLPVAADSMVRRIMYFEFFGVVLDRVPSVVPHADGQLWLDAIRRPFMPRLLFPNKTAVNDSELTNRYTGIGFAT